MESYLSMPAIERLLRRVEKRDPDAENDQSDSKAMTFAITSPSRKAIPRNSKDPLVDHIVAEAQYPDGPGHPKDAIPRLKDKVDSSLVWFVQFSAFLFSEDSIIFYGDHKYIGEHTELQLVLTPGARLNRYWLNLRSEAEDVHSLLEYIATGAVRSPDVDKWIEHRFWDMQERALGLSGLPGIQRSRGSER